MRWRRLICCTAVLSWMIGCSMETTPLSQSLGDPEREAWIDRVAYKLRDGAGLGSGDDVARLNGMSDEEVVAEMMKDPRFIDTTLRLNLFFLGRSFNTLRSGVQFRRQVIEYPQAFASAMEVDKGGDYFQLLDKDPVFYWREMGLPGGLAFTREDYKEDPDQVKAMVKEFRDLQLRSLFLRLDERIEEATSKTELCAKNAPFLNGSLQNVFGIAGIDNRLTVLIQTSWQTPIRRACDDDSIGFLALMRKIQALKQATYKIMDFAADVDFYLPEYNASGNTTTAPKMHRFDVKFPELGPLGQPFTGQGQWSHLPNESTNVNRTRAAYMLRTYLCDDLTPLDVIDSVIHKNMENQHATDPACRSCHYKLDPMGGLFRMYSATGQKVTFEEGLYFSDGKQLSNDEFRKYVDDNWGAGDELFVGVTSKPNQLHPLWQGDDLSDFWDFAKKSKEVRQCLVRRIAEFFLGGDQVYDPAWLEDISRDFRPGPNSAKSYRKLVKDLVTSNTFRQDRPVKGRCYDHAQEPGRVSGGMPCAVRSIIEKNCAQCHNGSSEDTSLDLTAWRPTAEGKPWFDHPGTASIQDSIRILLERINTSDVTALMPPSGKIGTVAKQTFYHWLSEQEAEMSRVKTEKGEE